MSGRCKATDKGRYEQREQTCKNKAFGVFLTILGVFGFLIIIHRLCYYKFEYDAKFSPVDYGKFNILSFSPYNPTCSSTSI